MKSFLHCDIARPTLAATIACIGLTSLHLRAIDPPPPAQPVPAKIEIADGPFQPTWESLKQYRCPDWFRDAKLGIWGILTPQSLPEAGDWYARHMYIEGMEQYRFHLERFGHPPEWWPRQWFWRMRNLIETYQPDLMYSDGAVPFGEVGRSQRNRPLHRTSQKHLCG